MKAYWYEGGDSRVGLDGGVWVIDLGPVEFDDDDHRERVRAHLAGLDGIISGGSPDDGDPPIFDDELDQCWK